MAGRARGYSPNVVRFGFSVRISSGSPLRTHLQSGVALALPLLPVGA